jgi:2-keto-4-pentenoate hydratase
MSLHEDSVQAFVNARAKRPSWAGIAEQFRPATIRDGYRLQQAIHAQLGAAGHPRVGYKIGSTSAAGQRTFGLAEPVYAGLFDSGRSPTLADALARPLVEPSLECEIALILQGNIDGADPDLSTERLADAVGSCHIACEIIDNRYGDPLALGVPSLIADDFFHEGFVIGAANPEWRDQDLASAEATMDIDGKRTLGTAHDVMSAFVALRWLARALAISGNSLHAGDIVMTGSITVPTRITLPAQAVTLSITGFAPLRLEPAPR